MSSKKPKTPETPSLKVKTAIKAGRIALNHNARPAALKVKTAVKAGFGVRPKGPGPTGPGG